MSNIAEQRLVTIDVTPENTKGLSLLLIDGLPHGEYVIAEQRMLANYAYDFLAAEYGSGGLKRQPLLADVAAVTVQCPHRVSLLLGVTPSVTDEALEVFRLFCRDGIGARLPVMPPCACGAPSTFAWAGQAACQDHMFDLHESLKVA